MHAVHGCVECKDCIECIECIECTECIVFRAAPVSGDIFGKLSLDVGEICLLHWLP